jgi:tripeptide aminopeptidase
MDPRTLSPRGRSLLLAFAIGTAQEELGLKGMIHWLENNPGTTDMLIAMDGGLGAISYGALGIYWTRYHFRGEGSHTNRSAGRPHPARALAEAVASIYEIEIPSGRGGAVYNVGMLDGGSVFNAIPERVSFTMDLRSVNPELLDELHRDIEARVAAAAAARGVDWEAEEVNRMPAGGTAEALAHFRVHPLIVTAEAVYGHLRLPHRPNPSGSTDANAGVVRGIPSIAVGRSQGGGPAHPVGVGACPERTPGHAGRAAARAGARRPGRAVQVSRRGRRPVPSVPSA